MRISKNEILKTVKLAHPELTNKEIDNVIDTFLLTVQGALADKLDVHLGNDIGSLKVKTLKSKTGNVNGKEYSVPERSTVKLVPSKALKEAMNK